MFYSLILGMEIIYFYVKYILLFQLRRKTNQEKTRTLIEVVILRIKKKKNACLVRIYQNCCVLVKFKENLMIL